MEFPFLLLAVSVAFITCVAMVCDIRFRRIPNWLTVSGLVGGVAFHALASGWTGLFSALGGFAAGFGILLVLWLIGGGGGGDVKLAGAIGAWLGAPLMLITFILSALLSVTFSIVLIVWFAATRAPATANVTRVSLKKTMAAGRLIPYAVPLTLATWVVLVFKSLTIYAQ